MRPILWVSTIGIALSLGACAGGPAARDAARREDAKAVATTSPPSAAPEVELRAGTVVVVRLQQALATARNRTGDTFAAILDEPVLVDGRELLHRGTRFMGHVTTSKTSGRLEGRGVLGITLDSFELDGQPYAITTSLDTKTTEAHKKRNIEVIGGGTGLGALIGGLTGGGKGAGIGAAVGAAAGTGAAAATGKKDVEVPTETAFRFSLRSPVRIRA